MGFLAPLFLALGLGAAVPLLIHLLRRRTGVRVEFPAVRYLARAEQEHSRRLKLRNLLLMLLRVLAVRLRRARRGAAGERRRWAASWAPDTRPSAIAIVLDNSLSTSVIVSGPAGAGRAQGGRPARRARRDRRRPAVARDGRRSRPRAERRRHVAAAIARTDPLAGAGDLPRAVARGAALVRSVGRRRIPSSRS